MSLKQVTVTNPSNPQLFPLQVNSRGEPFLPLRKHKDIILTSYRASDYEASVKALNDPKVHPWLKGPPYPHLKEDAEFWAGLRMTAAAAEIAKLEAAAAQPEPIYVDDGIITAIRHLREDGSDEMIGSIDIIPCHWLELADLKGAVNWADKEKLVAENNARKSGDPDKIWTVGYWLASTHHGKGVMSDALDTLLHEWAVPRQGVHRLMAMTYEGNHGSYKVLEKCGLKYRKSYPDHLVVKGIQQTPQVFDWFLEDQDERK